MNGESLRTEQGYPIRLVVPGWEGNMWVKWLRRIEFGDKPYMTREETSKYTDLLSDGKARMFTWVMDAKSVITSPCPEKPVLQKGIHQIRGLAWSGRGKIKRVDVSLDGGKNWKKVPVSSFGLPSRSFVNDIKADIHDENTVYVVLDNHKEGDFNPYLFKSEDQGNTWLPISNDLPKRTLLWRIVQDHVKKDLFFLATEFGIYTSLNGCKNWQKLNGTPNMGFRDLVIQKRENDLVAASFGRGIYIIDDYSPLRNQSLKHIRRCRRRG